MKQKTKLFLIMLLSAFVGAAAFAKDASDLTIKGRVLDVNGAPIPGAGVQIKGQTIGTVTDLEGAYQLENVAVGSEVEISSLGFTTVSFVADSDLPRDIVLKEDQELLEEVLVIGYGTQRRQEVTGAVASVKEGQFNEGITSNAFQMLIGKAAGVNVSQTNSAPGSSSKIQIRGAGSINSSNDALVVVDGLPGVDPSSIQPGDIESIEVLKDASAAAIYGTRAANGVVLITTKSGSKGAIKVNFTAEGGVQSVAKKLDLLNAKQYMETLNAIRTEGGKDPIYTAAQIAAAGAGTDWQDEIFRNAAPVQNYNLSVSGSGDKHSYFVGLGYTNQQGLVKRTGMDKYNVRTNVNVTPKDFLRFKLNLNYTRKEVQSTPESFSTNENAGAIGSAVLFDPSIPAGINPETGRYYQNDFIALDNPSALVEGVTATNASNNVYGTFTTEIEPLKNLVATARLGASVYSYGSSSYNSRITKNGLAQGGIASQTRGESMQWMAEFLLSYKTTFAKNHNLKVLAGATFEQMLSESVSASARKFLSDATGVNKMQSGDAINGDDVSSSKSRNRLNGFLGRINYDYKNKYLLTASFRYDGTSRFADANKYAFFPSVAAAWRISEENFLKNTFVNDLKLRVGYGELGNEGIGNYMTIETLTAGGKAVFGNDLVQGLAQARLVNPNLRWETTAETNIGIDFGFFKSRIYGSVDFFIRDTKDQLFDKPMPGVIGFSSMKVNMGTVRNSGIDFTLNTVNFDKKKFGWNTQLNLSFLKNEVISLPPFISDLITGSVASFINGYQITRVGDPIYSYFGYEVEGIFQTSDDIAHSAQPNAKPGYIKYKDQDGNGSIGPEDRVILGKPFPDCTLGFTNDFRLGNFRLSIFLQGVFGINTLDAQTVETLYPANEYRNRMAEYYLNRWTPSNPSDKYPSGVDYANYGGQYQINSMTVVDASFLRIKNIHLDYNIPIKKNKVISGITVYGAVDNVYTFTNYKGFDPDASSAGSSSVSKVNYNNYPLARTFRAGLNLTF